MVGENVTDVPTQGAPGLAYRGKNLMPTEKLSNDKLTIFQTKFK